jgi:hypothetical protein
LSFYGGVDNADDEFDQFTEVIFNRANSSNGSLYVLKLFSKDPLAELGSRPTAEIIRNAISSTQPPEETYQAAFIEALNVKDWSVILPFLIDLAASGGPSVSLIPSPAICRWTDLTPPFFLFPLRSVWSDYNT